MVGRENCLVHHDEAEITLVSYKLKFCEKGGAPVLMEKWDRSVLVKLILTPCCHCAESEMPRSVTVRHGFFPMWKGQGPSIIKNKVPCAR